MLQVLEFRPRFCEGFGFVSGKRTPELAFPILFVLGKGSEAAFNQARNPAAGRAEESA